MSLQLVVRPSLQLLQMSEEYLVRIFGCLGLKDLGNIALVCTVFRRIQEENSLWKPFFPEKFMSTVESLKERAKFYWVGVPVFVGDYGDLGKGILNFRRQTVTQLTGPEGLICFSAMKHPEISNGSFIVYNSGLNFLGQHEPAVIIKNQKGSVYDISEVRNVRSHSNEEKEIFLLRLSQCMGTEYVEFTLIYSKEVPNHQILTEQLKRLSREVRGLQN